MKENLLSPDRVLLSAQTMLSAKTVGVPRGLDGHQTVVQKLHCCFIKMSHSVGEGSGLGSLNSFGAPLTVSLR